MPEPVPETDPLPTYDPDRLYTWEELPYDARIRDEHPNEWIAWNRELNLVVATGTDREAVRRAAIFAGVERPVMEWVRPPYPRPLPGEEELGDDEA